MTAMRLNSAAEAIIVRLAHRLQPKLGQLLIAPDMDMRRLVSIARKEEEAVRADSQDRGTHEAYCCIVRSVSMRSR
jgi:hypothetical protein